MNEPTPNTLTTFVDIVYDEVIVEEIVEEIINE
jgi:hypothetical protein